MTVAIRPQLLDPFAPDEANAIRQLFFKQLTAFDDLNRALEAGRICDAACQLAELRASTAETALGVQRMADAFAKRAAPEVARAS